MLRKALNVPRYEMCTTIDRVPTGRGADIYLDPAQGDRYLLERYGKDHTHFLRIITDEYEPYVFGNIDSTAGSEQVEICGPLVRLVTMLAESLNRTAIMCPTESSYYIESETVDPDWFDEIIKRDLCDINLTPRAYIMSAYGPVRKRWAVHSFTTGTQRLGAILSRATVIPTGMFQILETFTLTVWFLMGAGLLMMYCLVQYVKFVIAAINGVKGQTHQAGYRTEKFRFWTIITTLWNGKDSFVVRHSSLRLIAFLWLLFMGVTFTTFWSGSIMASLVGKPNRRFIRSINDLMLAPDLTPYLIEGDSLAMQSWLRAKAGIGSNASDASEEVYATEGVKTSSTRQKLYRDFYDRLVHMEHDSKSRESWTVQWIKNVIEPVLAGHGAAIDERHYLSHFQGLYQGDYPDLYLSPGLINAPTFIVVNAKSIPWLLKPLNTRIVRLQEFGIFQSWIGHAYWIARDQGWKNLANVTRFEKKELVYKEKFVQESIEGKEPMRLEHIYDPLRVVSIGMAIAILRLLLEMDLKIAGLRCAILMIRSRLVKTLQNCPSLERLFRLKLGARKKKTSSCSPALCNAIVVGADNQSIAKISIPEPHYRFGVKPIQVIEPRIGLVRDMRQRQITNHSNQLNNLNVGYF